MDSFEFDMPEFDDDDELESEGVTPVADIFSRLLSDQPGSIQNKLNVGMKDAHVPEVPDDIFKLVNDMDLDISSLSWSEKINKIRDTVFKSENLAIVDSTGSLRNRKIEEIHYIIANVVDLHSPGEGYSVLSPSVVKTYAVEVLIVFGPEAVDKVRWLLVNVGTNSEYAMQLAHVVHQIGAYGYVIK